MVKVLVADDESRIRKIVKDFLVAKSYEVIEASDGEEAIDIFGRIYDKDQIRGNVAEACFNNYGVCICTDY